MAKFFYDYEFIDDGRTITPLSVGMVTDTGAQFYRVYADWMTDVHAVQAVRNHQFLMNNVVPHLPEPVQRIVHGMKSVAPDAFATHPLIVPTWRLRLELEAFIRSEGEHRRGHELWAYYGAYDHVALAQTFGTMISLPTCVPMFTNDLMQLEAAVNYQRVGNGLPPVARPDTPLQAEHHAMADARWNKAFHEALVGADLGGCPDADRLAWTIDEERDLVTVPSRVFVAGYERLESVGPNEGLDPADEEPARRLWDALL
jgi:hypothetical protein